jgi:hypothetical protein
MASQPKVYGEKFAAYKRRLQTIAIGHTGNAFIAIGFDYGAYGLTIATLGPVKGGLLMIAVSFLLDLVLIKFYDWSKTDWLGIETLKDIRENPARTRLEKLLQWLLRKGDAVALVVLSLKLNPFNVMLYLRRGAYLYNGMGRRDWLVLVASTLIGNLYWILVMWGATSGLMHVWETWIE